MLCPLTPVPQRSVLPSLIIIYHCAGGYSRTTRHVSSLSDSSLFTDVEASCLVKYSRTPPWSHPISHTLPYSCGPAQHMKFPHISQSFCCTILRLLHYIHIWFQLFISPKVSIISHWPSVSPIWCSYKSKCMIMRPMGAQRVP